MTAVETASQQSVESYVASLPAEERELARHVLLGYINAKTGRPVGFHHAPNGVAPPGRRIDEIVKRYLDGSYLAVVSFWEPTRRAWIQKGKDGGIHTMFPDHLESGGRPCGWPRGLRSSNESTGEKVGGPESRNVDRWVAAQGSTGRGDLLPGPCAMTSRWTFTPSVHEATREPPLPHPEQLEPLRDMLGEIGYDVEGFLSRWWPDLLARRNDPDAEYCGNGVAFRVSGDEVILTPLYDQWDDAAFVYVPLADVQEMIDQFAEWVRSDRQ